VYVRYLRVTAVFARPFRGGSWRPTVAWADGVHRGLDSVPTRSEQVTLGRGSRRPTDGCKSFHINSEIQIVHNIYIFFYHIISPLVLLLLLLLSRIHNDTLHIISPAESWRTRVVGVNRPTPRRDLRLAYTVRVHVHNIIHDTTVIIITIITRSSGGGETTSATKGRVYVAWGEGQGHYRRLRWCCAGAPYPTPQTPTTR